MNSEIFDPATGSGKISQKEKVTNNIVVHISSDSINLCLEKLLHESVFTLMRQTGAEINAVRYPRFDNRLREAARAATANQQELINALLSASLMHVLQLVGTVSSSNTMSFDLN